MSNLQGKRIALVGGAGFVGHHLALALSTLGAHVSVIDNLSVNNVLSFASNANASKDRELYLGFVQERLTLLHAAGVQLYTQDVRDGVGLRQLFDTVKPEAVVHLAAMSHAGRSDKEPLVSFDHNLRTLQNVLDVARSGSVKHFVFFSSSLAYGHFETDEVDEEHPLNPIGIYGAFKLAAEKIVIAHRQVFGLPYTIVRPSALYGARCVSRRVCQIFIENAIRGKGLRIDGDGRDRLDFTHIQDLVNGVILILQNPASRDQAFNLTYGQGRSLAEIADLVTKRFPNTPREHAARISDVPARGTLIIAKAARLLGFKPEWSIDRGIPDYMDWYESLNLEGLPARTVPV
jgi:nucleoside-diphosphate-sugar epimerase